MSPSRITFLDTTASTKVLAIPELMELVERRLSPADLCSCVRVCQAWNRLFIPLLWHTIDTDLGQRWHAGWGKVFHNLDIGRGSRIKYVAWLQLIFLKYGHHIRHLSTTSYFVIGAISINANCRHLRTLRIHSIKYHRSLDSSKGRELAEAAAAKAAKKAASGETVNAVVKPPPVKLKTMFHFPTLPWITPDVVVTWKQGVLEDRHVFERIWTLLRQNPRLVVLDIPLQAGLRDLPESFIITTLSSMQHLKELRLTWHTLDTETFLTAIPRLERLCIFNLQGIISKQEDFGDLRYFYIQRSITVNELSAIVERLPKLEDLRISSVRDEDKKEPATVWTGKLFRLVKKLKLNVAHDFNDDTIALLVRLFPAVVSVHIPTVFEKTKEALWENCYDLDEIVSEEAVSTDAWRQRRLEDAEKQSKECKHDN